LPLDDNAVAWLQLALSAAGVALLGWSYVLERDGRSDAWRRPRAALLAALGILGAARTSTSARFTLQWHEEAR
jgi:hypothetical protein